MIIEVIVTGEGKAFCAGADLTAFSSLGTEEERQSTSSFSTYPHEIRLEGSWWKGYNGYSQL